MLIMVMLEDNEKFSNNILYYDSLDVSINFLLFGKHIFWQIIHNQSYLFH